MSNKHGIYPIYLYLCVLCVFLVSVSISAGQSEVPQQVLDWQKAAQDNIAQNDIPQAVAQYQQIIQTFPNAPYAFDAYTQMTRLYIKEKNFEQVRSAMAQLCTTYKARNFEEIPSAIPPLCTTYRDQPAAFSVLVHAVEDCMRANAHPEAISICTEVKNQLALHPRATRFKGWLGMVYAYQKNFAQAEQITNEFIQGNDAASDFLDAMGNIGWGYHCAGQWSRALAVYRQGLQRYPDEEGAASLQYHIAQTYLKQGDTRPPGQKRRPF